MAASLYELPTRLAIFPSIYITKKYSIGHAWESGGGDEREGPGSCDIHVSIL